MAIVGVKFLDPTMARTFYPIIRLTDSFTKCFRIVWVTTIPSLITFGALLFSSLKSYIGHNFLHNNPIDLIFSPNVLELNLSSKNYEINILQCNVMYCNVM